MNHSPKDTPVSEAHWKEFRRQMPVAGQWAYFDHAAVAPLSGPARNALSQWGTASTQNGGANWPQWWTKVEQSRARAAAIIAAQTEEIALVGNTTAGINLVAEARRQHLDLLRAVVIGWHSVVAERDHHLRAARPRPPGGPPRVPEAEDGTELSRRPFANQPARLQQHRGPRPPDRRPGIALRGGCLAGESM